MVDLKDVLRLVNEARKALGEEPLDKLPKGRRNNGMCCPIAKSIGGEVEKDHAYVARNPHGVAEAWGTVRLYNSVELPSVLKEFVWEFDAGNLKELEG